MTASGWARRMAPLLQEWDPAPDAAVLVGSHARDQATPWSDIDVVCVADTEDFTFQLTELGPVSWTFGPVDHHRGNMMSHSSCAQVVPAWRDAVILHDPHGQAQELQRFAQQWSWDQLDPAPETWAARQIPGYAEEVLKLRRAVSIKDWTNARVQASIIAVHLGPLIAAGTRTFFTSENHLWHLIAEQQGESWRSDQNAALSTDGEDPEVSCAAAIRLFEAACDVFQQFMSERQRSLIRYALEFEG